jgi:hypothetical protein
MFRVWHGPTPRVERAGSSETFVPVTSQKTVILVFRALRAPNRQASYVYLHVPNGIRTYVSCKTISCFTHDHCDWWRKLCMSVNLGSAYRTAPESVLRSSQTQRQAPVTLPVCRVATRLGTCWLIRRFPRDMGIITICIGGTIRFNLIVKPRDRLDANPHVLPPA